MRSVRVIGSTLSLNALIIYIREAWTLDNPKALKIQTLPMLVWPQSGELDDKIMQMRQHKYYGMKINFGENVN